MSLKSLRARWRRENIIYKQDILFGAAHSYKEKKNSELSKKVNRIKPNSQERRGDSVKRAKMQEPQL